MKQDRLMRNTEARTPHHPRVKCYTRPLRHSVVKTIQRNSLDTADRTTSPDYPSRSIRHLFVWVLKLNINER